MQRVLLHRSRPRRGARRVQHAHRVRQPIGPLDARTAPYLRGHGRRILAGPASALAFALVVVAAAALRPWDGRLGAAPAAGAVVVPVTIAPDGPRAAAASAAPRGDAVAVLPPADTALPGGRDAWRAASIGPLPPEMLTGYVWPTRNARITNSYGLGRPGSFRVDGRQFHDGIDVSSYCGARVTAAHDGVVLVAGRRYQAYLGWIGDLGPFRARMDSSGGWRAQAITVVVDDGNGYRSVYAHLGEAKVKRGDVVRAGDLLGWEGASGNASGCHLHYSLFSPLEDATLALDPKLARTTKLPPFEIARIDPLLVLPPPSSSGIAWSWGSR